MTACPDGHVAFIVQQTEMQRYLEHGQWNAEVLGNVTKGDVSEHFTDSARMVANSSIEQVGIHVQGIPQFIHVRNCD